MTDVQVIPMLRIFDYAKAIEFYVGWLGFEVMWEHEFEPGMPKYLEIKRDNIVFHLTEHHGDGTPGSHVFIWCKGVKEYHKELIDKKNSQQSLERRYINVDFLNSMLFAFTSPGKRPPT